MILQQWSLKGGLVQTNSNLNFYPIEAANMVTMGMLAVFYFCETTCNKISLVEENFDVGLGGGGLVTDGAASCGRVLGWEATDCADLLLIRNGQWSKEFGSACNLHAWLLMSLEATVVRTQCHCESACRWPRELDFTSGLPFIDCFWVGVKIVCIGCINFKLGSPLSFSKVFNMT